MQNVQEVSPLRRGAQTLLASIVGGSLGGMVVGGLVVFLLFAWESVDNVGTGGGFDNSLFEDILGTTFLMVLGGIVGIFYGAFLGTIVGGLSGGLVAFLQWRKVPTHLVNRSGIIAAGVAMMALTMILGFFTWWAIPVAVLFGLAASGLVWWLPRVGAKMTTPRFPVSVVETSKEDEGASSSDQGAGHRNDEGEV